MQEKGAGFLGMMGKRRRRVALCMKKQPKWRRWTAGCMRAHEWGQRGWAGWLLTARLLKTNQAGCGSSERVLWVNWRSIFWREEGLFWLGGESPWPCLSLTQLWDAGSGSLLQKLPADLPVLDICPLEVNQTHLLATLTEKMVNIYKWQWAVPTLATACPNMLLITLHSCSVLHLLLTGDRIHYSTFLAVGKNWDVLVPRAIPLFFCIPL